MNKNEPMIEVVVDFFNYNFLARKSTVIEIVENLNAKIERDGTITANEILEIINESLLKNNAPITLPDKIVYGDYMKFRRREDNNKIFDCCCWWRGEKEIAIISTDLSGYITEL